MYINIFKYLSYLSRLFICYFRKIGIPCFDVSALLVNQIKEWSTETCPGKSQRCLYSVSVCMNIKKKTKDGEQEAEMVQM